MEQSLPIRFSPHIAVFALRLTLGTVIASALQVAPAMASWPHDGNNLPIAVGYYYHENPVIVSDGAGGAIIAWQENHGAGAAKDIAAQHVLASGIVDPTWPFNGRAICSAVNQQQDPKLVSDGAGGAIIVWEDLRSGTSFDLYAQHVLASGVVDPVWPVDGRAIAVAAGDQFTPVITTDGAGGAIMAWRDARNGVDDDVFAQRITAGGNVVFAANGVNLTSGQPGNQNSPSICPDGFGGAVVAWTDARTFATTQNDIYAQRINSAGFNYWTAGGKVVYSDNQEQEAPIVIQDMTGGFLFVWMDKRGGANFDIYAQRWNQAGTVEWAAPSRPVCVAAGDQTSPSVVADGQGGAQIAWQDARGVSPDIYTQHLLYTGLPDPSAPVDGRALCNATGYQGSPVIAPDGDGGAIVTWTDYFVSNPWADLYSGHVLASGAIDPAWPVNGRALSTAPNNQYLPSVCSDGAGGTIVAFEDTRNPYSYDIYAQRVARFGYLGSPEASIHNVRDVPADQGGKVKLSWDASYLDRAADPNLNWYEVYRSVPPFAAARLIAGGARVSAHPAEQADAAPRALLATPVRAATYYWEYLATINAQHFLPGYSYLAATSGDSTVAGNPKTLFMVVARNVSGSYYWLSLPDSGYSVDNLPPAGPAPFTATYGAGATSLHWGRNAEPDFALYRLCRGISPAFVPGSDNLVATKPDTGYVDAAGQPYYYKLAAEDVHGNLSPFVLVQPSGTTGVGGTSLPSAVFLATPSPNPAHGGTALRFGLPAEGRVSLALFDQQGRRIRDLIEGVVAAGEHVAAWDGRDNVGRLAPSGLYFVQLKAAGRTLTQRLVAIQ